MLVLHQTLVVTQGGGSCAITEAMSTRQDGGVNSDWPNLLTRRSDASSGVPADAEGLSHPHNLFGRAGGVC